MICPSTMALDATAIDAALWPALTAHNAALVAGIICLHLGQWLIGHAPARPAWVRGWVVNTAGGLLLLASATVLA